MYQINYEVFDKLLAILYEKDGTEPVYIAETVGWILGKEVHQSNEFFQIYPKYMAELREHDLARERGFATIMDITSFGRKVYKAGGWVVYLKRLDDEAEQLRQNERAEKRWNRSEVVASIGGLIVGILGFSWGIFQYVDSKEKDQQIKVLQDSLQVANQKLTKSISKDSLLQLHPKQNSDIRAPATNQKK